jgi:cell division protein FtsL
MTKKRNFSSDLQFLFFVNLTIIVLLLSIFNLSNKTKTETKVLGTTTDNSYWEEMVKKHPTYKEAWVELGRMDKVYEIDPNYGK